MSASTLRFARHYAEMVGAMLVGMLVLGMPLLLAAGDAPALELIAMAVSMTVPMVTWMRYRGHGWPACSDMTAAMAIPTAGVLALLGTGAVEDEETLMMLEHVVMLPAMLVAMLLRRDEYTGAAHRDMVAG
jgi:hypothetical protein